MFSSVIRILWASVDIMPADRREYLSLYRARNGDKPMDVLSPGYCGRRLDERRISNALPRRAVIVGSFDWIAKRMNLAEFVDAPDPMIAHAGAQLQAVASAQHSFPHPLPPPTLATPF